MAGEERMLGRKHVAGNDIARERQMTETLKMCMNPDIYHGLVVGHPDIVFGSHSSLALSLQGHVYGEQSTDCFS